MEDSVICMLNFGRLGKYFGLLLAPRNCKNCVFAGFRLLFQKVFNMKARNLVYGVMEDRFMYMLNFSLLGNFFGTLAINI